MDADSDISVVPVTPSNPMKPHALMMAQAAPYLLAISAAAFVGTLWFANLSWPHAITGLIVGVASFPVMWRHWTRPNMILFLVIVFGLITSSKVLDRSYGASTNGSVHWPSQFQFLSFYAIAVSGMILIFRRQIMASLNEPRSGEPRPTGVTPTSQV